MIRSLYILSAVTVLQQSWCFPDLRAINAPQLEIFTAGEVNNLSNEQQKRSIESHPTTLNDVEATVREVQDMIKANPALPRLTRGEILDILENITKTDIEKATLFADSKTVPAKASQYKNHRDPKAIMVVMPYMPSNPNDDKTLEALYTKPPITHIIGAEPFTVKQNSVTDRHKNRRKPQPSNKNTFENNYLTDKYSYVTGTEFKKITTEATTLKTEPPTDYKITTSRPTRTTVQILESKTTQAPKTTKRSRYTPTTSTERSTETVPEVTTRRYNRRRPPLTTEKHDTPSTTYRPRGRRPLRRRTTTTTTATTTTSTPSTTTRPPVEETTIRYPNHRYPGDSQEEVSFESLSNEDFQSGGIKVIQAPQLALPSDINGGFYDLVMQENRRVESITKEAPTSSKPPQTTAPRFRSTTTKSSAESSELSEEINLPEHLHGVVNDMKLDSSLIDIPEDYHKKFQVTTHSPSKADKQKIQALIDSMVSTSEEPEITTQMPDVSNIADTLSPEMRDLLMSFGLIPNPNEQAERATETVIPFVPDKAEVDPASFSGFKPLPEDGDSRDEMESLLAAFGLGRSARKQKALVKNNDDDKNNQLNFDVVPEAYKHVIEDIGFGEKSRKLDFKTHKNAFENSPAPKEPFVKESSKDSQRKEDHNEDEQEQYATPEELRKLQKLMSVIQHLERLNRTVTDEDLKEIDVKALKELMGSLNHPNDDVVPLDEQSAPNPINYGNDLRKNEVKRQQLSLDANLTIVTPSSASASGEESKSPNLEALEESFGGKTSTPTTTTTEPTTTTLRTGFYYLADWNSFFDIDDQKGKRVNLRFQPTIGNPKNFLSVSVP